MLGKTHVLIGNVALLALTHHLNVPLVLGVTLGALAPDIDRAGSLITHLPVISWLTRPASRLAEQTLRHRTGTHSLLSLWLISVGMFCLREVFTSPACGAFLLGYLSHLLADALTISGVPLLWPWRTRAYGLPAALRIRTGGRVEYALTLLSVAAGLWGLRG